MRGDRPGTSLPRIGSWVPAVAVRALFAAVAATLCTLAAPYAVVLWLGLVLTAVACVRPRTFAAWLVLILLGTAQVGAGDGGWDWRVPALLAGLHALHVLGSLMLALPSGARVQLAVLGAVARRFVLVQVPVQAVAALVLWLVPGPAGGAGAAVAGTVAAVALGALAVVLLAPHAHRRSRKPSTAVP